MAATVARGVGLGSAQVGVFAEVEPNQKERIILPLRHATTDQFRTGWFVASVLSASRIVLAVRSRRPFFRSRPGKRLPWATPGVAMSIVSGEIAKRVVCRQFEPTPASTRS